MVSERCRVTGSNKNVPRCSSAPFRSEKAKRMLSPAKVKRPAEERDLVQIRHAAEHYVQAAKGYKDLANSHKGF